MFAFKIQQLGIDGPMLNLLFSYLSQRSQVVLINRTLSDLKYTSCGVPQGSVLGPLLFLIYVNDIAKNINLSISLFADDSTLYYSAFAVISKLRFTFSVTVIFMMSHERSFSIGSVIL